MYTSSIARVRQKEQTKLLYGYRLLELDEWNKMKNYKKNAALKLHFLKQTTKPLMKSSL